MLGYGFPVEDFWACMDAGVDAIVVDSGSTDPGPYQLGLGATLVTADAYERDLRPLLQAVDRHRVPLLISSAGGAGTNAQVDAMAALVGRIATEEGLRLRVATVYADVPASIVEDRLHAGMLEPNVRGELPTAEQVRGCAALVAQMGDEPFRRVLDDPAGVDVVVAGRAYDPAPHAAWAMRAGADAGIAWHMGKVLECGGACAEPKGGGVLARIERDAFELDPMSPGQRCTPLSVAAHTLYEKSRPDLLPGPTGVLDVTGCSFTAVSDRVVRVTGSHLRETARPTVKVEGAAVVGHRAVFFGAVRDPVLIGQIDGFLKKVQETATSMLSTLRAGEGKLIFHVYGRNGVMGDVERVQTLPHELAILCEVTAPTPEKAKDICTLVRVGVLHLPYDGQLATAGNLALPLTPLEIPIGPVCAFAVYHVMDATGLDLFPSMLHTAGALEAVEV
jgi:hypothetical protein